MPSITEGNLTFVFPDAWNVEQYDRTPFYRNQFQRVCGGCKGVDILAIEPHGAAWLIEVKDYRVHPRKNPEPLPMEVATKVRDTLAGLVAAGHHANDSGERDRARRAVRATGIRVVLHLEAPSHPSRLNPPMLAAADYEEQMAKLLKPIDPHVKVVSTADPNGLPWTAT